MKQAPKQQAAPGISEQALLDLQNAKVSEGRRAQAVHSTQASCVSDNVIYEDRVAFKLTRDVEFG